MARNAQKEFLIGQSSRSHATCRQPICGFYFNRCLLCDVIYAFLSATWHGIAKAMYIYWFSSDSGYSRRRRRRRRQRRTPQYNH